MKTVFSCPEDELPLKSDKYAAICTDLHLGNRGITHLRGFQKFVSLDTLWLNNNKLESIEGLEENSRLKGLHLYVNRIKKLVVNSFAPFKLLERITLNGNFLEDLDGTLGELKNLRNLQSLDLFDNPIAKEDNYRLRVLAAIPSLSIFDLRRVTDAEKIEVSIFRRRTNELNQFNLTRSTKLSIARSDDRGNTDANALRNIRELLCRHAKGTRCFMEMSFLEIDKRHLGTVHQDDFWRVMQLYGHAQLLNEGEKLMLMEKYRRVVKVKAVSATGVICKALVNYVQFCRDMLPVSLRTINDNEGWRTERAPEVSVSTAALGLYVRTVKEQRRLEETNTGKLSSQSYCSDRPEVNAVKEVQGPDFGLNPWEAGELSRIISGIDAPPAAAEREQKKAPMKSPTLTPSANTGGDSECTLMTREQCDFVFERFSVFGKVPMLGATHCLDMIFDHIAVGATLNSQLFRAAVGCPPCPRKSPVLSHVRNAVSAPKSRKPETTVELRPVTVGPVVDAVEDLPEMSKLRKNPMMRWRDMTESESLEMDRTVSERAGGLFESLLHAKDPSNVATLTAETMRLSLIATRIGGQRIVKSSPKLHHTPCEVIAAASNRADVIVLPNLKINLGAAAKLSDSSSTSNYSIGENRGKKVPLLEKTSHGNTARSVSRGAPSLSSSTPLQSGWAPGTVTLVLG